MYVCVCVWVHQSARSEIYRVKQENEQLELNQKNQESVVGRLNETVKGLEDKLKV